MAPQENGRLWAPWAPALHSAHSDGGCHATQLPGEAPQRTLTCPKKGNTLNPAPKSPPAWSQKCTVLLAFWAFILAFWGFILAFWAFILAFWGFILAFWGFILAFWASILAFWPSILAFWSFWPSGLPFWHSVGIWGLP